MPIALVQMAKYSVLKGTVVAQVDVGAHDGMRMESELTVALESSAGSARAEKLDEMGERGRGSLLRMGRRVRLAID